MCAVETRPDVSRISKTTPWPAGGANVQIEPGVAVKRGVDFGEIAGRGVKPDEDGCPSEPIREPLSSSVGIYNMNA